VSLTLTVGPATDYLFGLAQTAVSGVSVTVDGQPVAAEAIDGEPSELSPAQFVVGLDSPPPDTSGSVAWTGAAPILGGPSAAEDYLIPCYIDVRGHGDSAKVFRDIACGMFNTFWNALMANRSLGGLLAGGGAVITAVTGSSRRVGTDAARGQRYLITFSVRCTDLQLG